MNIYNKTVKKAGKGNKKAFEILIKKNEMSMYRVAKSILKKDNDCADAIQETEYIQDKYVQNVEVHEAVNYLDDKHKPIVTLYYFEDFSVKQISGILKLPEGTIKSRLSRAREKLKAILGENERSVYYE